jgi:hypothetical protein
VYRTDQLVQGGGNLMIEITRQAIADCNALLRARGKKTPSELWLQFDNCGENKNRVMFSYLSLLVEGFFFKEIEMCFLIVGHTHSSIDQYFSVISKAIDKAKFIGKRNISFIYYFILTLSMLILVFIATPLGLMELIRRCHVKNFPNCEPVIKDLVVYYDMKTALEPFIKSGIVYFRVPHCFKFSATYGHTAMCQYKMFSFFPQWLPIAPNISQHTRDGLLKCLVSGVQVPSSYAAVGGEDALLQDFKLGKYRTTTNKSLLSDGENNATVAELSDTATKGILQNISVVSIQEQADRMDHEDNLGRRYLDIPTPVSTYKSAITKKLKDISSEKEGYIIWLDHVKAQTKGLSIADLDPKPYNPVIIRDKVKEMVSYIFLYP